MNLTPELEKHRKKIEKHAREYGLDFFDTIFEVIDYNQMHEFASYSGFPIRYPHWKFGMEYEKMKKLGKYGFMRIGEMVINNDPCYAYLQESNELWHQKMVIAHVYGHCDFFKNNAFYANMNRNMVNELANHGNRIESYMEKFGENNVEDFLTKCFSIDDLIDYQHLDKPIIIKPRKGYNKFKSKEYMDQFINPPQILKKKQKKKRKLEKKLKKFSPKRDMMLFLIENAPLKQWQRNILSIIREESYYFSPQWQTKIMNEGWASFWHSKIMVEKGIAGPDIFEYADYHSKIIKRGLSLNPYRIGLAMFKDIEERWNKGKFGKEWEECNNLEEKENWDKKLGLGRKKIFEVRKTHNDATFIHEFFTEEVCKKIGLFTVKRDKDTGEFLINRDPKHIKNRLLELLTNGGSPIIRLVNDNYENRKELLLSHKYYGRELDVKKTTNTLKALYSMWRRPVHLDTFFRDEGLRYFADKDGCFFYFKKDKKKVYHFED